MTYEPPEQVGRREEHWTNGRLTVTSQVYRDPRTRDRYRRTRASLRGIGASVVLPLLERDGSVDVVFTRQYRYGVDDFVLELPAGVVDEGESPEDAARREVHEETGYRVGTLRPLVAGALVSPGWCDERQWYYYATDLTYDGGAVQDPYENVEVEVVSWDDLPSLVRDGRLVDAKTLGVLGAVFLTHYEMLG